MENSQSRILLPEWMAEEVGSVSKAEGRFRLASNFLGKGIRQMNRTLAEELRTETYASRPGVIQFLDPRIKLVAALSLIIVTGLSRSLVLLFALWVLTVLLMRVAELPVIIMQKRIWGFIPLMTLLVSLPAMFNFVIDGRPLIMFYQSSQPIVWLGLTLPESIYISQSGVNAAGIMFLRVGLSISMGVLLTLTTPMASLCRSLQLLRMPPLFIMIIEMSYRYLVILLSLSIEMFEARSLRTVGCLPVEARRAQVGSSLAALFARSVALADEVFLAMIARGYTGQGDRYRVPLPHSVRITKKGRS